MRPRVFDAFMYNGEADILECRIREIHDLVDFFVVIECGESHLRPGIRRQSEFSKHSDRFQPWNVKIRHFFFPELQCVAPIDREHEQREKIGFALRALKVNSDDVVIQSDVDEIPSHSAMGAILPHLSQVPMISFAQSLHCFAVDWRYPTPSELKPTACFFGDVRTFTGMRLESKSVPTIPNGGWHLSWMGTTEDHLRKIDSIYEGDDIRHVREKLASGEFKRNGVHVDGVKMTPVEADAPFPEYVRKRLCPPHWFRLG